MDAESIRRVERWIAEDPDLETRRELEGLLARGAEADLAERFAGRLEFGTAGLRGVLGAGPMRMNRAVVRRTTAGLAAHLERSVKDASTRGVVVGYDARRMSRELAEEAARVLAGMGIAVELFEEHCPTPFVAFRVLEAHAAAGIMVTASHNPPEYNGFKVYWESGAQIIPPHDALIGAAIDAAGPAAELPAPELAAARSRGLVRPVGSEVEARYLAWLKSQALHPEAPRELAIVYTPLHGVGGKPALSALSQAGFARVVPVEAQLAPDGRFPTVRFPNPEERGALDLALALARGHRADLVIANDPDADRLAIAVPTSGGDFVQLSGDQVGALLGHYLLTEGSGGPERLVVTTVVSSSLLCEMARALGVCCARTLTGFKWIASRALALEAQGGARFVFGYEEALGYAIGQRVRDKDGISAAVVFAELAAVCKARGISVLGYLEAIYRRFGLFATDAHSLSLPGASGRIEIQAIMDRLRAAPPRSFGEERVEALVDVSHGLRFGPGGEEHIDLPPSDVLTFELGGGGRVTARPSGTEPKIKFYFELREAIAPLEPFAAAQARAAVRMARLKEAFLRSIRS